MKIFPLVKKRIDGWNISIKKLKGILGRSPMGNMLRLLEKNEIKPINFLEHIDPSVKRFFKA